MKTRLMMFVAVIALFVFNGCSDSKESYVKDFKKFIEKVEAHIVEVCPFVIDDVKAVGTCFVPCKAHP